MSKQTEALKLAQDLRALADRFSEGWHEGIKIDALDIELLANAAEALAEQPAQHDYRIKYDRPCYKCRSNFCPGNCKEPEQPAQQDNPHPEYCKGYASGLEAGAISEKKSVQQQEPVAWMDGYRNIYSLEEKAAGCPEATIALVPMANHKKTSGSPINELQCVCGAVWLGEEMVHLPDKRPPASKPWVGLTDEEMRGLEKQFNAERVRTSDEEYLIIYPGDYWAWQRAIEAKLREKNA